jgi:hypothetical protein
LVKRAKDHQITLVGPARPKARWHKPQWRRLMDTISSRWTGSANKCAVPRANGRCRGTSAATPVVIPGLPRTFARRIVPRVRHAVCVPARPIKPGSSNSCPGNSTRRYNKHELFTLPRPDSDAMRDERALKAPSHRVFVPLAHGAPGIGG